MNKIYIFIAACILSLTFSSTVNAQTDFSLSGLGRVNVSHDKLEGNLVDTDLATPVKGVGGYILFDLKPTLKVNNNLYANAILRVRNEFGAFFGDGTTFEFRQFQVMGKIGKSLDYQIGDINVEMTPYTVYAFPEMYHKFESEVHGIRRSIVNYENFVIGNAWRLQGVQGFAGWDFNKGIKKLGINAFGVRTNPTNDATIPDRVVAGTRIGVTQSDLISLGGNYVGMLDIPIDNAEVDYTNHVLTGDLALTVDNDALRIQLKGETGMSSYDHFRAVDNKTVTNNDFFYDVNASAVLKSAKVKVYAGYRDVGPEFSSPTAQTRRIDVTMNPTLFPKVEENLVDRGQILFDRFTSETIYNRGVNAVLYQFLPEFNNILPYGDATPNRRGITAGIGTDTSAKVLTAEVRADLFNEIIGEGVDEKRKFVGVKGGVRFNLGKLLDLERNISLNAGMRYEKTTRDGAAEIDFTSNLIDAGFSIEVVKKVDLLGGAKILSAEGTEYRSIRDDFNQLSAFPVYTIDRTQTVYTVGARVKFGGDSFFTVNYNIAGNNNNLDDTKSYNINQLFFNYTLIIP